MSSAPAPSGKIPEGITIKAAAAPGLPLPTPRIEVRRPAFGEIVEPGLAGAYPIELDVRSYVLTRAGQGLIVSLNGGRPKRWSADSAMKLGDLVPDAQELARGPNVLFAAFVDGEGRVLRGAGANGQAPFFIVDFFIGPHEELPSVAESRLFCLAPVGTHYGRLGDPVRLELFPTGASTTARVRFVARGLDFTTSLDPRIPHLVHGLPPGDLEVFATSAAGGSPARCVATLNPELEVKPR